MRDIHSLMASPASIGVKTFLVNVHESKRVPVARQRYDAK